MCYPTLKTWRTRRRVSEMEKRMMDEIVMTCLGPEDGEGVDHNSVESLTLARLL
jgi:hypothetical protein